MDKLVGRWREGSRVLRSLLIALEGIERFALHRMAEIPVPSFVGTERTDGIPSAGSSPVCALYSTLHRKQSLTSQLNESDDAIRVPSVLDVNLRTQLTDNSSMAQ